MRRCSKVPCLRIFDLTADGAIEMKNRYCFTLVVALTLLAAAAGFAQTPGDARPSLKRRRHCRSHG